MTKVDELAQSTAESIGRHIGKDGYQPAWAEVCIRAAIDVVAKSLLAEIKRLRAENEELQASLDLQQAAYRRAKDRWQAATGRSDIWPDLADLCVWLMETTERLRAIVDRLTDAAGELLAVADLRGDTDLPHPCDDDRLWTARMGNAWDEMRAAAQAASQDAGSRKGD